MSKPLCICGQSQKLPFCDGSHRSEGWVCGGETSWTSHAFCSSPRYANLALKLASHFQGTLVTPASPSVGTETLVCLVDGTDLDSVIALQKKVEASRRLLVSLGIPGGLLSQTFPDYEILSLEGAEPLKAFSLVREVLEQNRIPTPENRCLRSAFVSHAVLDEPILMKAVDYLRQYFDLDLFLCADSIGPGQNWQATIHQALLEKDVFVVLISEHTLRSHFCSFELGVAVASEKPMLLLSLDGSRPQAFVQHLQVVDLPRLQRRRPWLDLSDVLLWELLEGLACPES